MHAEAGAADMAERRTWESGRGYNMKIGFIGLGNVGGKLAGSLLRNGFDLTVRDLDRDMASPLLDLGAHWAETPKQVAEAVGLPTS